MEVQRSVIEILAEGRCTFMGLEFAVGTGALVPREETELLAHTAVETLRAGLSGGEVSPNPIVFDVCCGVGNLACAIATAIPEVRVIASDISPNCVALACQNVIQHGLQERVTVLIGDLFQPFQVLGLRGQATTIVCNPPYISSSKLDRELCALLEHEPREAFDAGPFGIAIHQRVCREAPSWLHPGGWLLFEYGAGQGRQLEWIFQRTSQFGAVELIESRQGGTARSQLRY